MKNLIAKIQQSNIYRKNVEYRCNKHFLWLLKYNEQEKNEELNEIISYIKDNHIKDYSKQMYYSFCDEYDYVESDIFFDDKVGLFYACGRDTNHNRMYFARSMNSQKLVYKAYRELCAEQNPHSPHCYLSEDFKIKEGGVETVVDIGAAEGNFSLEIVEQAKKVYLFECEPEWKEALNYTFAPYASKINIVNKYVSDTTDEIHITLDQFFSDKSDDNLVIKMDVEGAEKKVLQGMKKLIAAGRISKILVCAYHNQSDEVMIKKFFENYKCKIYYSHGYIMRLGDIASRKPYYRRGVMRIVFDESK